MSTNHLPPNLQELTEDQLGLITVTYNLDSGDFQIGIASKTLPQITNPQELNALFGMLPWLGLFVDTLKRRLKNKVILTDFQKGLIQ